MLTSGHKMDESGLADVVGKLHPMYQSGFDTGSSGREPSMDLNRVTRLKVRKREDPFAKFLSKDREDPFKIILNEYRIEDLFGEKLKDKPTVEMEADPAKASFRQGYVDGLNHFMQSRGIDFSSTGLFQGVSVITTDDGLVGFVRGARLESPSIPRNYNPSRERGILEKYIERDEPDFGKEMRFKNMVTQAGYKLGFVVGAAREHGVVLKGLQVPMDNASYTAFSQGLNGEARPIPFEGLVKPTKKEFYLSKEESPLVAEMRTYEFFDSQAYHTGLQLWLKSQGVQGVVTRAIRHPEALRAFKAALGGQTLSEYEPKPIKPDFTSTRDWTDKQSYLIEYLPDKKRFLDEPREPTPAEIARQQGQMGYNLGKSARLLRTPNLLNIIII